MKSILGVVLIILLFVMLTGCSDEVQHFRYISSDR